MALVKDAWNTILILISTLLLTFLVLNVAQRPVKPLNIGFAVFTCFAVTVGVYYVFTRDGNDNGKKEQKYRSKF